MTIHAMVDIESLGFRDSSVVLSIGACKFDPRVPDKEPYDLLYMTINADEQFNMGRTYDDGTLEWWAQQKSSVFDEALDPAVAVPFKEAFETFNKWYVGSSFIWSRGPDFDMDILGDCFQQLEMHVPWKYHVKRDVRTIYDLADPDIRNNNAHNALDDAISQAIGVRNIYAKLGVTY